MFLTFLFILLAEESYKYFIMLRLRDDRAANTFTGSVELDVLVDLRFDRRRHRNLLDADSHKLAPFDKTFRRPLATQIRLYIYIYNL